MYYRRLSNGILMHHFMLHHTFNTFDILAHPGYKSILIACTLSGCLLYPSSSASTGGPPRGLLVLFQHHKSPPASRRFVMHPALTSTHSPLPVMLSAFESSPNKAASKISSTFYVTSTSTSAAAFPAPRIVSSPTRTRTCAAEVFDATETRARATRLVPTPK